MTDDPRRRHLTPEEAAELRRRARERRGYADPAPGAGGGSAGAPRRDAPRGRPAAPEGGRPGPREGGRPGPREGGRPAGRAGYQPRQEPQPLPPDERARLRRQLGQSEQPPRARSAAHDPRRPDPRDPRAVAGDPRHVDDPRRAADPRDPRRALGPHDPRRGPGGRDPMRVPVDGRRGPRRGRRAPRPTPPGGPRPPRRRRLGPVRILGIVLAVALTLGVVSVLWADSKLQRIDALTDYPGRGGNTPGTVTLLVGTDSREGLTPEQQAQLATGSQSDAGGKRTDTMMLVYTPRGSGETMLISLPRDLLVDIPGYGQNKLNAAYTFGGPALLTRTLEEQTGMRIDHYSEIGFGGFAGIVDAVGGVEICIEEPIHDPMAGLDLAAGCQTLAGPQALGFVRTRYGFAEQDLQRVRNQRQFLGALMSETLSPGNLLNPFTAVSLIDAGAEAVTVDTGDHIWNLGMVMWRLTRDPMTVTAPYDGTASGAIGSYLVWGANTTAFFDAVASGRTPPQEFLETGP